MIAEAKTATREFKQSDVGEIPKDWTVSPLGRLISSVEYGSSAKSAAEGRVPVLRMGNLQDGKVDWSDLVFSRMMNQRSKYTLQLRRCPFQPNQHHRPGGKDCDLPR